MVIGYQLFFDLVIFDLSFGVMIWSGIAVMVFGYGATVVYNHIQNRNKVDDNFTRIK